MALFPLSSINPFKILPAKIWDRIFWDLDFIDIVKLSLVCKKSDDLQLGYMCSLIKKVNHLRHRLEGKCYIPAYTRWEKDTRVTFECQLLKNGKLRIQFPGMLNSPDCTIKAKIRVVNIPAAEDALEKSIITFFRKFKWIDYASISLVSIDSFKMHSESGYKKKEIVALLKATNSYLNFLTMVD